MSVDQWGAEPPRDCPLCPRLVAYREANRAQNPDWWNGPAPSFGDPDARLLVAGLAPGRTGANRTGRPFTGDGAGWMLYETLLKHGLATGQYRADPSIDQQYRLIVEHYGAMLDHYGSETGVKMARKHLGWYTKGLPGSAEFRNRVNFIDDAAEVLASLERFYEPVERRAAA